MDWVGGVTGAERGGEGRGGEDVGGKGREGGRNCWGLMLFSS